MKKTIFGAIACLAILITAAWMPAEKALTRNGKEAVVNTAMLKTGARGYRGNTPVKIYLKDDKVVRIEPLANKETPDFFAQAVKLLKKYEGKKAKKAEKMKVDVVTGATYSSEALIKNVQMGLRYYNQQ